MSGFCHRAGLLLALILGFLPMRAMADTVDDITGLDIIGAGVDSGSWTQQFTEKRNKTFDSIVVWMISGNDFEHPTFRTFSGASNWKLSTEITSADPRIAVATGDLTKSLTFDLTFASPAGTHPPFTFWLGAFNDETAVEFASAEWTGCKWNICSKGLSAAPTRTEMSSGVVVPLPATAWMGMALLGAIAVFTIRRRARNAW